MQIPKQTPEWKMTLTVEESSDNVLSLKKLSSRDASQLEAPQHA